MKDFNTNPELTSYLQGKRLAKTFPLTTSISHHIEVLATAISQEKEVTGLHIRKAAAELSLFTDDKIFH